MGKILVKKRDLRFFIGKKSFLITVILCLNFFLFMLTAQDWVLIKFFDSLVLIPDSQLSATTIFPVFSALILLNFVVIFVAMFAAGKSAYFYFSVLLASVFAILFLALQIIFNVEAYAKKSETVITVENVSKFNANLHIFPFIALLVAFFLCGCVLFSFFVIRFWKKNNKIVVNDSDKTSLQKFDPIATWDSISSGNDPT